MTPAQPEQARSVERRSHLLTAATALLLSAGSQAVTHRRVAQDSESSLGAVRYYFSSREELLAACLEEIEVKRVEHAEHLLDHLPEGGITAERVARCAVEIYYGTDLEDAAVTGMVRIVMDCSRESAHMAAQLGAFRHAAQMQLGRLLRQTGYSHLTLSLVTAVIDGRIMSAALEGEPGAARIAMDELVSLFNATSGR